MAIEIILRGRTRIPKYKGECPICGCIFSYQKEDVTSWYSRDGKYYEEINNPKLFENINRAGVMCPHCNNNYYEKFDETKTIDP